MINRTPARDRPGALGWRRGSLVLGWRLTDDQVGAAAVFTSRAASNWASSPVSNISRTISQPPTNSPLTYSCGIVGQSENALIPWRSAGSLSTSIPLNLTPSTMFPRYRTYGGEVAASIL